MVDVQSKQSSNKTPSDSKSMISMKNKGDSSNDRKKLKVLKQALKDERNAKTNLEAEIKLL